MTGADHRQSLYVTMLLFSPMTRVSFGALCLGVSVAHQKGIFPPEQTQSTTVFNQH